MDCRGLCPLEMDNIRNLQAIATQKLYETFMRLGLPRNAELCNVNVGLCETAEFKMMRSNPFEIRNE